jgi:hypothetical protein
MGRTAKPNWGKLLSWQASHLSRRSLSGGSLATLPASLCRASPVAGPFSPSRTQNAAPGGPQSPHPGALSASLMAVSSMIHD